MKVIVHPKSLKKDLKKATQRQKQQILDEVEKLEERPTQRQETEIVEKGDIQAYRQEIEVDGEGFRALFVIQDDVVVVTGFMERPPEDYTEEKLQEKVESRSRSFR